MVPSAGIDYFLTPFKAVALGLNVTFKIINDEKNNLIKGFLCLGIVSLSIGCTNLDEQILDGVANDNSAGAH
jgi:hypothetical protein